MVYARKRLPEKPSRPPRRAERNVSPCQDPGQACRLTESTEVTRSATGPSFILRYYGVVAHICGILFIFQSVRLVGLSSSTKFQGEGEGRRRRCAR